MVARKGVPAHGGAGGGILADESAELCVPGSGGCYHVYRVCSGGWWWGLWVMIIFGDIYSAILFL